MTNQRVVLLYACVGLLAACQQAPRAPATPGAEGGTATTAPAPAPPDPTIVVPPLNAPATPATQQQAQRIALAAAGMLENGHEEQAKAELQRALAGDPNNKLALNLMRQITADPVAALGRESFAYTVQPNDTMSGIARRFLGDIYSFYILARYNNVAVPKQVAGGQILRIPGKAPAPAAPRERDPGPVVIAPAPPAPAPPPVVVAPPAPPEPTPGERAMRAGESAERSGDLERAFNEYKRAATLDQPGAEAKAEQARKQLVVRYSLTARTAFARQDLDGAIRAWDRVLGVDPTNETAKLERQRALNLKEKVKKL
ncbi:LysM domain-containing protein [Piscinibacter sp. XHJ-5]|uniref:LysM peptidoglycan-binding domain-containing protein n=1 Tax=Piscinibacter sp. XHJ-5 TaxID=3037797 RepID=UPI0024535438|nr:LysM domain-containing protein [Piscinibacter sp. XHJ-5]